MIKKTLKNSLVYILLIVITISNMFYIKRNSKIKLQLLTIGNTLQRRIENDRESFLRNQELFASVESIYIPKYKLLDANFCKSYSLTYFYSGEECEECVLEDIGKMRKLALTQSNENVLVLPVFNQSRNVEIALKTDLDGLNYIRLNRDEVVLPTFNGKNVRFFAVLTPEGELINIFFPDILMPEKTNLYIEFVRNKYL